jgi:uncharacterized protein YggE
VATSPQSPSNLAGPATVTVRGEAAVRTPPDEAVLWITLTALKQAAGEALGDVAERSERLSTLLDELQVREADRSTAGVSVSEEFDHTPHGRRRLGHRATARVTVRLADPDVIGRAISRASEELEAGIDGPRWYISPANPARLEAAREAATDARQRAEAYASGVGASLGALIKLTEEAVPWGKFGPLRLSIQPAGPPPMPIEVEEHEVHAAVEATFALEL